jgi:hypothetical protein
VGAPPASLAATNKPAEYGVGKMKQVDFEESVLDNKYTFRVYTDGAFEILRYGMIWIENAHVIEGSRAVFALLSEYHELRINSGDTRRPS